MSVGQMCGQKRINWDMTRAISYHQTVVDKALVGVQNS